MACLSAEFHCRSGMFYPEDPAENCLLNSESSSRKPELFVEESLEGGMLYFQPQLSAKQEAILTSGFKFNRIFRVRSRR